MRIAVLVCTATLLLAGPHSVFADQYTALAAVDVPNPFEGKALYHSPQSSCEYEGPETQEEYEARMFVCVQPVTTWVGDWEPWISSPTQATDELLRDAEHQGAYPVIVVYNIPGRDCNSFSAHETPVQPEEYLAWVQGIADGIGDKPVAIVLEPDALAHTVAIPECFTPNGRGSVKERTDLIRSAVEIFSKEPGASVYIDAGTAHWIPIRRMSEILLEAGIDQAVGFSLNIASRYETGGTISYAERLAKRVGGKGFVIDTSRNGLGQNHDWCNPDYEALGDLPTVDTSHPFAHALLWIKIPGESDGECDKGHPTAGIFWPEKLKELYQNSRYYKQ